MEEEKDLDVCKCGIFTAVFDSRKIISVTLLQSAIFCSGMEVFFFCWAFSLHQEKKHIKKLAFKNTMPVAQWWMEQLLPLQSYSLRFLKTNVNIAP